MKSDPAWTKELDVGATLRLIHEFMEEYPPAFFNTGNVEVDKILRIVRTILARVVEGMGAEVRTLYPLLATVYAAGAMVVVVVVVSSVELRWKEEACVCECVCVEGSERPWVIAQIESFLEEGGLAAAEMVEREDMRSVRGTHNLTSDVEECLEWRSSTHVL